MRNGCLTFLLVAAAAFVAGCGGDDKPDPPTAQEQVRTQVNRMTAERDPKVVCSRYVTQRFITEVFEDVQACQASKIAEAPEPEDGKTKVVDVKVTGPKALVEMRQVGGRVDGAGGHLTFAREGQAWKLDHYETDYIRSILLTAMEAAGDVDNDSAFTYPPLSDCIIAHAKTEDEQKSREFLYSTLRGDQAASLKLLNARAAACPEELAGYVTDAIIGALDKDGKRSAAFERCARRQLNFLLQATGLGKEVLKGNVTGASSAALQGLALGVNKTCSGK